MNIPITEISIIAEPSWKDNFPNHFSQTIKLPGFCVVGKEWSIVHHCAKCNNLMKKNYGASDIIDFGDMSMRYYKSNDFIKKIAESLGLEYNHKNNGVQNYLLNTPEFKYIASVLFYTCEKCKSNYIVSYCILYGDTDRNPESDKLFIEKILPCDFEREQLLKIQKESFQ